MDKSILIIGDIIIDEYFTGTALKVSEETPTIVAKQQKVEKFLGGAGFVLRNLLALGSKKIKLFSIGDLDRFSDNCQDFEIFKDCYNNVDVKIEKGWKTPRKSRYFVDGYKLLQFDILNEGKWTEELRKRVYSQLKFEINNNDVIIISDNRHGVLDEEFAKFISQTCLNLRKDLVVDCQFSQKLPNHEWYRGAKTFLMNKKEFLYYNLQLQELMNKLYCVNLIVKEGADGFFALLGDSFIIRDGYKVNTVDTCGAGDAFLAAYVFSNDLKFANKWAALSTTYVGTKIPTLKDLEKFDA